MIIDEFRAIQGRVGGPFEGAPLMHHRGRKRGREDVPPVMFLPSDDDRDVMYIFASKNGAPDNPAWYHNLVDAGTADVEVGTDSFPVSVSKVTEPERGRVSERARRYPAFGEYPEKTSSIRKDPGARATPRLGRRGAWRPGRSAPRDRACSASAAPPSAYQCRQSGLVGVMLSLAILARPQPGRATTRAANPYDSRDAARAITDRARSAMA